MDTSGTPATRYRSRVLVLASYGIAAAIVVRGLMTYFGTGHPLRWVAAGLLAVFVVLAASEPLLTGRFGWYPYLYVVLQACLITILSLLPPSLDFFAALYLLLSVQAMLFFPQRAGLAWLVVFSVMIAVTFFYSYGWLEALPLVLMYTAANFLVASFAIVMVQVETARQRSQNLLSELQDAHRQLQTYAAQAEELAATKERSHLARELHDSVAQTIFSMTLTAEAARILLDRDPAQVASQLDKLQDLARGALAEMRSLVFELRPGTVETEGLIPALRRHLAGLKDKSGLAGELRVEGESSLDREQESRLFRIAQEALNNVCKHAETDRVVVTLAAKRGWVSLEVEDHGRGFDPGAIESGDQHMGFSSMRERAEIMGGTFTVGSTPGKGTRVRVEVPLAEGDRCDG